MEDFVIRRARVADTADIMDLVNGLAADKLMLGRSPASILENIRDFVVAEVGDHFGGCAALAIIWSDIAEVRSLAVAPEYRHLGIGRAMTQALLDEAEALGIARVMAFTYVPQFFEKLGFRVVEHASLPHKVFNDCLNCPKFHKCDEVAVLRDMGPLDEHGQPPERGPLSLPRPGTPLPRIPRPPRAS